jgi:predicted SAM-dependent methyltransferase
MNNVVKVNIGSGTTAPAGWINIDKSWNIYLSKLPIVKEILHKIKLISDEVYEAGWQQMHVVRHDITQGLPFKDGTVDYVYCSHVIEHLTREEAMKVCGEVHRILKQHGVFRVVVPDLKLYARKYVEGDKGFFGIRHDSKEVISDMFLKSLNLEGLQKRPYIERRLSSEHKWMYDLDSLTRLLNSAGFRRIRNCRFRKGSCPDLGKIETRRASLYTEAHK